MAVPLRQSRLIANDYAPHLRLIPSPAPAALRVAAVVRLPPAAAVRQEFSFAAIIAVGFLAATILLLGAVAGTVFWFTYDAHIVADAEPPPAPPPVATAAPTVIAPVAQAVHPPVLEPLPPPTDIVLPASSLVPPPDISDAAAIASLHIAMRDAETGKTSLSADAEAMQARMLAKQGDIDAALIHLDRAARLEPENNLYRFELATLYDRAEHGHEALMLYRDILADDDEAPALAPENRAAVSARIEYLQGLEGE